MTRKTDLFDGQSRFKFNNLRPVLSMALKSYNSMGKRVKVKRQELLRPNSYVWRSNKRKTGWKRPFAPSIWIALKVWSFSCREFLRYLPHPHVYNNKELYTNYDNKSQQRCCQIKMLTVHQMPTCLHILNFDVKVW